MREGKAKAKAKGPANKWARDDLDGRKSICVEIEKKDTRQLDAARTLPRHLAAIQNRMSTRNR